MIKSILKALTAFDWVSPTVEIARTAATGDMHIWVIDEDMARAEKILARFGGRYRDFDAYNGGWVFSVPEQNYNDALYVLADADIGIIENE